MTAKCVSAIQARVARLVKLDVCGNPVTGASSSQVVTDGFVSIQPAPQYLAGVEHSQRKASGALCVYKKDPNELTRVEVTINWCILDPDAIVIITGERLLSTSTTGTGVAFGEGQLTTHFSLEVWQPVAGAGECDTSGNQVYVYWAFPNLTNSQVSDFTFENGILQFTTKSETRAAGPQWGDGPGTVGPWLPAATTLATDEHFAFNITSTAPPVASCGATLLV